MGVEINLGNDTTICEPLVLPTPSGMDIPPDALSITWSTGDTGTPTITVPDTSQIYWVSVEVSAGCFLYDEIRITEFGEEEQVYNYWHFGDRAGINFSDPNGARPLDPGLPLTDPNSISPDWISAEGCTSISDRNGELVMYSDGTRVFNRDNELMPGPVGTTPADVGGEPESTQSSIIIQLPENQPYYYIFTTRPVFDNEGLYTLNYSLVDIKQDSANGRVLEENVQLFSRSTERLTAFGGGGQDAWIVVHEYGNNTFRSYPITAEGIGEQVLSSAGTMHSFGSEQQARGYMKMNGQGTVLAVALNDGNQNYIELFNFNSNSGEITEAVSKINAGVASAQIYGLEFSPGGDKLFASFIGTGSTIREFQIDSLDRDYIESVSAQLNLQGVESGFEYGAIQVGPQGNIYVAVNGENSLGTIGAVEDSLMSSTFTRRGFDLTPGTFNTLGLPNFSPLTAT
jgi:hypothetical protein